MLPSQIIPALPRQKVKYELTGEIAHVLNVGKDGKFVSVQVVGTGALEEWQTKFCEPVPEEPRPLRVGDKAYALSDYQREYVGVVNNINISLGRIALGEYWFDLKDCRHATPSEVAQYFAPNA